MLMKGDGPENPRSENINRLNATTTTITTSTNQALSIEGQQLDTPTSAYTTIAVQQDAIESEGSQRGPLHLVNVTNAGKGQFKALRRQSSSNEHEKKTDERKPSGCLIDGLGDPSPDDTAGITRG